MTGEDASVRDGYYLAQNTPDGRMKRESFDPGWIADILEKCTRHAQAEQGSLLTTKV